MKIKFALILTTLAVVFIGCQQSPREDTPTEAYKRLYAAVKSKNTEAIKKEMSSTTHQFATAMAQMQKKTEEDMYKNGFTETTMGDNLPPMRDERIKGDYAALEVQNPKGIWEDLPFVKENGKWKLAIGDLFQNTFQSPGMPASKANANTEFPVPNGQDPTTVMTPKVLQMPPGATNANVVSKKTERNSNVNAAK
jgi:hypothetical protein